MRFHIISDLHLEFGPINLPKVDADCIIVAGDVSTKLKGLKWLQKQFPRQPVVYVLGNHEFYGDRLPRLTEKLIEQAAGTNIHVLEDEFFEIGGYQIFGATLWTDFALLGDRSVAWGIASGMMTDFKRIRHWPSLKKWTPRHATEVHARSVARLQKFFGETEAKRTIIVTHHAPSARSLPDDMKRDMMSNAYASNLEPLIDRYQPTLWVHGHIHQANDYKIGETRVISNPRGYPDEPVEEFRPGLVLELE